MRRMTLLPQEFCSTQKEPCPHLPSDHVRPLVDQDGQVAVGLNPVLISIPYDGFGGRSYDQLLLQFCIRINDDATVFLIVL